MKVRTIAAVVVLLLLSAAAQAQAQVTLQYRWKQGEALVYRTTMKTTTTMSGMQEMGDVSFEQTMTQRIRLLAAAVAPDGSVTLHQTTEAVRVEMGGPMGKASYDSDNPKSGEADDETRALGRVFGGIVGTTLSITMAADGAVQRIDGVQKVIDKITQDNAGSPMAPGLKSVLSPEAIRASLEQSFPRLPPQPAKPGETWTAQVALGTAAIGRIVGTQTFTLKSADGPIAAIAVALALTQESAPPIGPAGTTMKMGQGKGDGQIEFDVANGRIRKSTMSTDIPSTMTTTGRDGRPATMKNSAKTSMTMELVEK